MIKHRSAIAIANYQAQYEELLKSHERLRTALEDMLQGRPTKEPPRDMVAAYRNWLAFERARKALKLIPSA